MKLNLGSVYFNVVISAGGANPSWGTEMGQGAGYKFNFENQSRFLEGMMYKSVEPSKESIYCPLGKGGNKQDEYEYISAALFDKIFVNGIRVENARFLLLIVKKIKGNYHVGRMTLKYGDNIKYREENINENCYKQIEKTLGISGAWFVSELDILDQEELHFNAIILDREKNLTFDTNEDWKQCLHGKLEEERSLTYDGEIAPIIYFGVPGTGKTFSCQNEVLQKYHPKDKFFVTFHQSFSYEEFVEGIKPVMERDNIQYTIEKGVFYKACDRAAVLAGYASLRECLLDDAKTREKVFSNAILSKKTVVVCIDEINRANVSAVFGDLISLIEPSKRLGAGATELTTILPYSKEMFGIPANLFIVGTMNTADRSIQVLDTALRRRFQFKEYLPDYDVLRNEKAKTILQAINGRIRALLGQDRQMGHSYFYDIEASAADESIRILKALTNKIIPLLQEYFYNDVEKIRFVLGEKDRIPDEHSFYIEDGDATAAFSRYDSDNEETSFYTLNTDGIASASMSNESASTFIDHITA